MRRFQDAHETFFQHGRVLAAEFANRVVVGMRVAGEEADGDIGVRGAFDGARTERAGGVTIDRQAEHHAGRKLFTARSALVDAQGGQWQALDGVENVMDKVVFGHPLPQIGRQQHGRVSINVDESCCHAGDSTERQKRPEEKTAFPSKNLRPLSPTGC